MELNHDLVRYILLAIEASENITGINEDELLYYLEKHGNYNDRNSIAYTVSKLKEAVLLLEIFDGLIILQHG